ncbi:flagellar hook-length control protein FliK [uncultured Trichococcus sp.]|uniref:flagellar hook-length control protein FliK n=1 Tax=uncultured Trichococcus sp. TaxID=189665 RepID=UPI0029C719B3|nr:flagellar hook-length control protein FliK [uncultured Trichococcus sp.]
MITGLSSGLSSEISEQLPGSAHLSATKEAGLIFESVLSGMIKGKEEAPVMQEEPSVSLEPKDTEESADQGAAEQAYINLFPYRILQDGKSSGVGRNVPTDEKADQTGTWLGSVAEKQMVITAKLDYSAPAIATPVQSEEIEAKSHMESLSLSDTAALVTNSSESQAGERGATPEHVGARESGERESYPIADTLPRQTPDRPFSGSEIFPEQQLENSLEPSTPVLADDPLKKTVTITRQAIADESENIDLPEASAKASDVDENKAPFNQVPITSEPATGNVFGHKPSKVMASHIEDIQRTIEMQIEKTPVSGNTVVKIRLTPDNIGDIHVQLIKTKDSITAVLHVQDAETKGLLEEKLTLLMEPFKQSISEGPITLTVVADPSLAFSFSEGADPGNRKAERQESRKRAAKEKTDAKEETMTKQPSRGLSLLA